MASRKRCQDYDAQPPKSSSVSDQPNSIYPVKISWNYFAGETEATVGSLRGVTESTDILFSSYFWQTWVKLRFACFQRIGSIVNLREKEVITRINQNKDDPIFREKRETFCNKKCNMQEKGNKIQKSWKKYENKKNKKHAGGYR